MNVSALLCKVFGHQPHEYENPRMNANYTECARCCKRKNLVGYGWISEAEENAAKEEDNA